MKYILLVFNLNVFFKFLRLKTLPYTFLKFNPLTLIRVDFLGVRFEVGGGGGKRTPCLKLVRIMLESSNLARKYISICPYVVSENIPFNA